MTRFLIIPLLALGLAGPGDARAETIERFDAGFWQGGAQVDEGGDLFDCYLRAENLRDKYSIFLRYDQDGLHLTLADDTWALPAGDSFSGRVQIDTRFDEDLPGEVMSPTVVDYRIGFDENAWSRIKSGRKVTLEGPQGRISFPLTGTSKAMAALLRCADAYYADAGREVAPAPEVVELAASAGDGANQMTGPGGIVPEATGQGQTGERVAAPAPASDTPSRRNQKDAGADATGDTSAGEGTVASPEAIAAVKTPAPASVPDDPEALINRALLIATAQEDGTPEEAFAAADRAAQLGDRRGHWLTGRFALAGYGTDMPREAALARILLAAEEGHPEAQTFLAFEYMQSDDPVRQLVGQDYLNRAAAQAHAPALAALRLIEAGDTR